MVEVRYVISAKSCLYGAAPPRLPTATAADAAVGSAAATAGSTAMASSAVWAG